MPFCVGVVMYYSSFARINRRVHILQISLDEIRTKYENKKAIKLVFDVTIETLE